MQRAYGEQAQTGTLTGSSPSKAVPVLEEMAEWLQR